LIRVNPKTMIGHYTQLVWADTYLIGCGISSYEDSTVFSVWNNCEATLFSFIYFFNFTIKRIFFPFSSRLILIKFSLFAITVLLETGSASRSISKASLDHSALMEPLQILDFAFKNNCLNSFKSAKIKNKSTTFEK